MRLIGQIAALLALLSACSDYKLTAEETTAEGGEEAVPDIEVSPEAIDFGELAEGESASAVVTVQNVGEELLGITSVTLADDSAPYSITALSSTLLAAGDLAELTVTAYGREGGGEFPSSLLIDSVDPDEPRVEVPLTLSVPEPEEPYDTAVVEDPEDECECPEGYTLRPGMDICFQVTEEPATFKGKTETVCPIEPYFAYGMLGVRYPGGTNLQSEYWGQYDGSTGGPLNRVGIWGCESGSKVAGSNPVGEWIGFGVCLSLEDAGDYLIGAGSDNRMRLVVDGTQVFERNDGQTSSFNYWWLTGISLSSGDHVVELYGKNDGSIAGFGAEIVGPFAVGATAADDDVVMKLDYENNIAWSTLDAIGEAFALGEDSGWSCPDGTHFDACAEEPVCIVVDEVDCE